MGEIIKKITSVFHRRKYSEKKILTDRERASRAADLMIERHDKALRALHDR